MSYRNRYDDRDRYDRREDYDRRDRYMDDRRDRYRSPPRSRYEDDYDRRRSPPRYRDRSPYGGRRGSPPRYGGGRDRYDDRDRGYGDRDRDRGFQQRRPGASGGRAGAKPERTVFSLLLANLHRAVNWIDIKDMAKEYGNCTFADANKVRTGEGIVAFADQDSMIRAKEGMHNRELRGLRMRVEYEFPETAEPGWVGKVNNDHPPYFTSRDGDRHGRDRSPARGRDFPRRDSRERSKSPEGDFKRGSPVRSRSISR